MAEKQDPKRDGVAGPRKRGALEQGVSKSGRVFPYVIPANPRDSGGRAGIQEG